MPESSAVSQPAENTNSASVPTSDSPAKSGLLGRPGLQQFIKFCIVGASSTFISLSIVYFLKDVFHLERHLLSALSGTPQLQQFVKANQLYLQVAGTIGFFFGVTNGFYWNSRWTFPQNDRSGRRAQAIRFFLVNISGLVLNWIVTFFLIQILAPGKDSHDMTWQDDAAIFGAIFIVAFWNFAANKLWTFKK